MTDLGGDHLPLAPITRPLVQHFSDTSPDSRKDPPSEFNAAARQSAHLVVLAQRPPEAERPVPGFTHSAIEFQWSPGAGLPSAGLRDSPKRLRRLKPALAYLRDIRREGIAKWACGSARVSWAVRARSPPRPPSKMKRPGQCTYLQQSVTFRANTATGNRWQHPPGADPRSVSPGSEIRTRLICMGFAAFGGSIKPTTGINRRFALPPSRRWFPGPDDRRSTRGSARSVYANHYEYKQTGEVTHSRVSAVQVEIRWPPVGAPRGAGRPVNPFERAINRRRVDERSRKCSRSAVFLGVGRDGTRKKPGLQQDRRLIRPRQRHWRLRCPKAD